MKFSYTALKSFMGCEYSYYLRYVDKVKLQETSASLYGSAVHRTLQIGYENDLPRDDWAKFFKSEWVAENAAKTVTFYYDGEYVKKLKDGQKLVLDYYDKFYTKGTATELEYRFGFKDGLKLGNHLILGVIDQIDDKGRVIDYKSVVGSTPVFVRHNGDAMLINIDELHDIYDGHGWEAFGYLNGKGDWFELYDVMCHPTDVVLDIEYSSKSRNELGAFTLSVTPTHSVYKEENGEPVLVEAKDLEVGDCLYNLNPSSEFNFPDFGSFITGWRTEKRKGKSRRWDKETTLELVDDSVRYKSTSKWLPILKPDENLFTLLGLLSGDGYLHRNCWELTSKQTPELDLLLSNFGSIWRDNKYILSTIHSKFITECLGLKSGAFNKNVPNVVFSAPEDLKLAFIRGYLWSDGSITSKSTTPQMVFGSRSSSLIDGISYLLSSVNIKFTRGVNYPKYKNIKAPYYQLRVSDFTNVPKSVGTSTKVIPSGKPKREFSQYRIRSIRERKVDVDVYDLSVKDAETFVGGGVPVLLHNTGVKPTQAQLDFDLQFTLYSYAYRTLFGEPESGLVLRHLNTMKDMETEREEKDFVLLAEEMDKVEKKIKSGVFVRSLDRDCSRCFFTERCLGKKRKMYKWGK